MRIRQAIILAPALGTVACHHGIPGAATPVARGSADRPLDAIAREALSYAQAQLRRSADSLDPAHGFPRSTGPDGRWIVNNAHAWTSGFFAGELWYMYELTKDPYWRSQAERWTAPMEEVKRVTTTHDLGFMIFDSFGHEYRLTGDPHAKEVILEAASSLTHRFNPAVGATQSWQRRLSPDKTYTWEFPVIIDNLMNLQLLFWAGAHGGDTAWRRMAEQHALTSLRYHVRPDGSTGHVALFDPRSGAFLKLVTAQGAADTSVWARGQAWAVYGFTNAYEQTHRAELLAGAQRVADWFIGHLPADGVPYWDFYAPGIPATERDASAAAIGAAGLLKLAKQTRGATSARYRAAAEHILRSLATNYTTRGTASAAILRHSVGGHPQHVEIDVGLVYADYFFVEALLRYLGATDA